MRTLKVHGKNKTDPLILQLFGDIDENVDFQGINIETDREVVIDLEGIDTINSAGSREWIKWTHSISKATTIKFLNCGPIFLDYVNMIEGFLPGHGTIESFKVPYYCESCDHVNHKTYEIKKIKDVTKDIALSLNCPKCSKTAEVDVAPSFFKFLGKA